MKLASRLLLVVAFALAFSVRASAATETYVPDPAHSSIGFSIRHFFTKVPGSFTKYTATILVDRENLEKSSAEATITVASVSTGQPKRDTHLQQPEFFDAAKFPTITFKSKAWKKTGENAYDVTGDLTIKGVTKEVILKVSALGFGPGMQGAMLSGWEATTKVNRQDFGVSAFKGAVGDEVDITINVEAQLKK
ncbi:MAG TPA: YceI family protein [Opitutaceae bacterium]|nr:YceI family protein [Opitutaceae bacterium]